MGQLFFLFQKNSVLSLRFFFRKILNRNNLSGIQVIFILHIFVLNKIYIISKWTRT